jgi:glyoxylase-like metal-dependent hydrolase (beta-lactamase superfamily II)
VDRRRPDALDPQIVAGDAVLAENAEEKVKTMIPFARSQFLATRRALLDRGRLIIPGHGAAFMPRKTP